MQITYKMSYWDLFLINCYGIRLKRWAQVFYFFLFACFQFMLIDIWVRVDLPVWFEIIMDIIITGIVVLLGISFILLIALIQYLQKRGKGELEYCRITLVETGLIEETPINRTEKAWKGIDQVWYNDRYIIFLFAGYYAYFIPRKAFADLEAYKTFGAYASYQWKLAKKPVTGIAE